MHWPATWVCTMWTFLPGFSALNVHAAQTPFGAEGTDLLTSFFSFAAGLPLRAFAVWLAWVAGFLPRRQRTWLSCGRGFQTAATTRMRCELTWRLSRERSTDKASSHFAHFAHFAT